MIFEESHHSRKLVGRLDEGDDLVEALTGLCRENGVRAATLHGVGTLENVEVARFDRDSKKYKTLAADDGPFSIVQLNGNVATLGDEIVVRVDALLAAQGPTGQQIVFGQLREGEVIECEFVLEVYRDIVVERQLDPKSGMLRWESIRQVDVPEVARPATTPEKPPEQAWEQAAQAADEIEEAPKPKKPEKRKEKEPPDPADVYGDYDFDEPILSAGDILDHPKLGRCRVIKVEDDDYAHIRLQRGQIRKLSLAVCDVEYEGEEDDRNVFKVRVRK